MIMLATVRPTPQQLTTTNRIVRLILMTLFLVGFATSRNADAQQSERGVEVPSVILKLVSDVDIPAREQGVIESILVIPNQRVQAGQELATINDEHRAMDLRKAQLELEVATSIANSDIQLRFAQEELNVAQLDLSRGEDSRKRFGGSLSDSELDQLGLEVARAKLKLETVQLESKNASIQQMLVENQVKQVEAVIARHKIISPLDGVVASVARDAGEWVEPGDTVLRVIGISRMRAEGFIDANLVSASSAGSPVKMFTVSPDGQEKSFSGKISFISDEIDPVNQQVNFWAEIDNRELRLRPGDRGRLVILK
ncbi:MAG: RND family efflux transporter MFP subunit [Mariniblastus sp.]|jgi:RND family efflux transporter MFP subunit